MATKSLIQLLQEGASDKELQDHYDQMQTGGENELTWNTHVVDEEMTRQLSRSPSPSCSQCLERVHKATEKPSAASTCKNVPRRSYATPRRSLMPP